MKKIINLIIVLMIFVLTACSNINGNYYLIKDYSTIGIIQNYDKNDKNEKRIKIKNEEQTWNNPNRLYYPQGESDPCWRDENPLS